MDNSGVKAIFPSQRLAGQERRKTAETLVHLQYHNFNSQAFGLRCLVWTFSQGLSSPQLSLKKSF